MLLKRLEISGFKSFPDKTVFKFHQDGLTAVVGPNGCGKSNIVDAVRWALGEQSAKLLRGQMMEDVIFNGSDRRKPAGMAEVVLTFSNNSTLENQWRDYSEISVSRKLFRTGESEYLINGVPCRLKDVRELIADAGGSSRGYSIVEQGRVSLLINSKPEEKRALIEEAAGVLKYRLRRIEAERKLERTRNNLLRISDVLREVQRQLNSMKRSAAKARRYRSLREELSSLVLRLRFEDFADNEKLFEILVSEREKTAEELTGLESRLAVVESREEALRGELASGEDNITTGFEEIRSIESEIARFEGDISVREEAIRALENRVIRLAEDEDDLTRKTESDLTELQQLELDLAVIENEHNEHLSTLTSLEEEFKSSDEKLADVKREMDCERAVLFEVGTEMSRVEMSIESDVRSRETLGARKNDAVDRRESLAAKISDAAGILKLREDELARACLESDKTASELASLRESIQETRSALSASENRLVSLSEKQAETRGLTRTLTALDEQMEGLPDGVRSIMKDYRESAQAGVLGIVADYMEVPQKYEKAVMAVLGERLDHVIVDGPESGRSAVDYLKGKASGRGSFIPRTPRSNGKGTADGVKGEGIIGSLSGLVSFSGEINGLGDFLLGGTLLVEDLEIALKLWKKNGFTATMVTLDGDVLDPSGTISGGNQSVEETPLGRKRKIRELHSLSLQIEKELSREKELRDQLQDQAAKGQLQLESLEERSREAASSRISSEGLMSMSTAELEKLKSSMEDLDSEIQLLDLENRDLTRAVEENTARFEELKKKEEQTRQTLVELEETVKGLEIELAERRTLLEQSRIKVSTVELRRENSHRALDAARNRNRDSQLRKERLETDIRDARSQIETHKLEIEAGRESVNRLVTGLEEKRESLRKLRLHQDEARQQSESLGRDARDLRSSLGILREKATGIDIRIQEIRSDKQHIADRVYEEHGRDITAMGLADFESEQFDRSTAQERIDVLRGKISKLGEVNPGAVEEFQELNDRYAFLSTQKKDLEESIESLQKAIRKINRTSRDKFINTFRKVNENFSRLFPRLITGGSAEMFLLDENDPLNTGVDINVRLPGKRVKSMQLLSGGEKAMVSLTMILSMFLAKPSPVCILDEVDAPLDDENLGNFAAVIREMSERFQFMVITHNKLTMEAVDVLYGITMREPGVSQVVSVKLMEVA